MIPDTIRCTRERAHQYGADAVILEKEAAALAAGPLPDNIDDCDEDQLRAILQLQHARDARRRYFRELAAIDEMTGNTPSPFAGLGK
jgi:hypothetical protein